MGSATRPQAPGELLGYDATGSYLGGLSRSTLKLLAAEDRIKRVRIGRRTFFTRASLDAFIRQLQEHSA